MVLLVAVLFLASATTSGAQPGGGGGAGYDDGYVFAGYEGVHPGRSIEHQVRRPVKSRIVLTCWDGKYPAGI
jgi:hypothetical protein